MIDEKPLFIPLRTEWFRKFESGEKDVEFRAYGPRWNEKTCRVGRLATVSHGYSGARLARRVESVLIVSRHSAPVEARDIFPNADRIIAISLVKP